MGTYSPASLPPITSVDVVALQGVTAVVDDYMQNSGDAPSVTLYGDDAQRVADLWRSLPPGEQARCHIPPYGLRFRCGERVICQASICWECDNIFGDAEGRHVHYEFESSHPTSISLLAEMRRAIGGLESS